MVFDLPNYVFLGMVILEQTNQGPGLVLMVSTSGSYLAQVAGEGAILLVQSVA